MSRRLIPQLSFADLQLQNLGIHLDPSLQRIAGFLKQHGDLVELVRKDLERGLKKPGAGRRGISPEQTLRSLILMRVKNLDYRDLRDRVNDGFTLRSFTQFDSHSVPQHDAFNRAFNGSPRPRWQQSIVWSSRPPWNSTWKTASNSASIPRSMLRHCAIPRYLSENIDC